MFHINPFDFGADIDDFDHEVLDVKVKSWHARRSRSEPACGDSQWRSRDRLRVIEISSMQTSHLMNCIRFAKTKEQHRSKLGALVAELNRRK